MHCVMEALEKGLAAGAAGRSVSSRDPLKMEHVMFVHSAVKTDCNRCQSEISQFQGASLIDMLT